MDIEVLNCNNIDEGNIAIVEGALNIKYAINGTGKTTLARAIALSVADRVADRTDLTGLTAFKNTGNADAVPVVRGTETLANLMVFDESYVDDFVFMPDELVKGSFEIFIRDANYEDGVRQIESLVEEIRQLLSDDEEVAALRADLTELSASFGRPVESGIHGSSPIAKALKGGNKVENIPEGLEAYGDYIQGTDNFKWIKWQLDGKPYIDVSENCPYCVSVITSKKDTIRKISEVYDSKSVESLNKMVAVFRRLNQYFSAQTKDAIESFVTNIDGYTDDQTIFLVEVKDQIDRLNGKFERAQRIGFGSLRDAGKVVELLDSYRIDLQLFPHLKSESTESMVKKVNDSLERIRERAGELQGCVRMQEALIGRLVESNRGEINCFLKNAGYKYSVDITPDENGEYRLKLVHSELEGTVEDAKGHLSFGERNAFALVLFMYDVLRSSPDLVVLDDPISSFDKNKKYAIIEMLFRKSRSLRGKTVLLLTHDFEPVVDMIFHHTDRFERPFATFLENTDGVLREIEIKKADVSSFLSIADVNIEQAPHVLSKLVYLRRQFEVTNQKGPGYHLISNIFHKRGIPIEKSAKGDLPMTDEQIRAGTDEIARKVAGFDYDAVLAIATSDEQLLDLYSTTSSNYEKLHLYRILFHNKPDCIESDVVRKFINEAFHIENDYIYQLNPRRYQTVPRYVIEECDKVVNELTSTLELAAQSATDPESIA